MNKEIKFRAWNKKQKRMFDVYGFNEHYVFEKSYDDCLDTTHKIEDCILLQYTGLKDKNVKEIYEGDIIQLINEDFEEIKVVCEFGKVKRQIFDNLVEITGFYFKRLCDDRKTFPILNNYLGKHDLELFEVIGNMHDNPELLEVANGQH